MLPETLVKVLAPLGRRIGLIVRWAVIRRVDTDTPSNGTQIELIQGELSDNVIHIEDFGLSSVPLPGSLGVVLSIDGQGDSMLVVRAHDKRYRPRGLKSGEVCLYSHQDAAIEGDPNDQHPQASRHRIMLTEDRTILMRGDRLDIRIGNQSLVMDESGVKITATDLKVEKYVPEAEVITVYLEKTAAEEADPNGPPPKTTGQKMADLAEELHPYYKERKYRSPGARPPTTFDCSAYIRWLYSWSEDVPYESMHDDAAGITRWSNLQEVPGGTVDNAQRGDILFFPIGPRGKEKEPNHIMLALGNREIIGFQSPGSGHQWLGSESPGHSWDYWRNKMVVKVYRFKNAQ